MADSDDIVDKTARKIGGVGLGAAAGGLIAAPILLAVGAALAPATLGLSLPITAAAVGLGAWLGHKATKDKPSALTAKTIFFTVMAAFLVAMAIATIFVFVASAQERHGWNGHRGGQGWGQGGQRHYYSGRRPGYRYEAGRGWFDPSAAIGGAVGGWLWRQLAQPEPQVVVVPAEPVRDIAYCIQRYRSYNPSTRTYLGFDGQFHGCP